MGIPESVVVTVSDEVGVVIAASVAERPFVRRFVDKTVVSVV